MDPRKLARASAALVLAGLLGWMPTRVAAQDYSPDQKPSLDPFVILIEKPKPPAPPKQATVFRPPAPTVRQIPPLVVSINALISSGDEYMAVIEYKGNDYVVGKGWDGTGEKEFDGRFKVVEIEDDKITVFDTVAKQRRTIREGSSTASGGPDAELSIAPGG